MFSKFKIGEDECYSALLFRQVVSKKCRSTRLSYSANKNTGITVPAYVVASFSISAPHEERRRGSMQHAPLNLLYQPETTEYKYASSVGKLCNVTSLLVIQLLIQLHGTGTSHEHLSFNPSETRTHINI
jgi:hypothetical protein